MDAPSAEAKKAEGARCEAFLSPRPPDEAGSDACNLDGSPSLKSMFVILTQTDKSSSSQDTKRGEEKTGDVLSMWRVSGLQVSDVGW